MVTYTREPVTPNRLAMVLSRLWPRGVEECERNGISLNDLFALFLHQAKQGNSGILCADGVPIMASGICPEGDAAFTWFQATDDFDRHAVQITKVLRRNVRAHEGQVYIYSVMVHPQTERWFNALGFVRDDWTGTTGANWPLFRFRRRACA